jgi:hypothetical protein
MDMAALEMDVACYATAAYHEGSNKYEENRNYQHY